MPNGCHVDRGTVADIARAGFIIEECDRFAHADGALEPAIPHVIGTARRTAAGGRTSEPPPAVRS